MFMKYEPYTQNNDVLSTSTSAFKSTCLMKKIELLCMYTGKCLRDAVAWQKLHT